MSHRTRKEMYPLIENWEKSGKSKKRFCEEVPINLHTFKYWLKKRNKERDSKTSSSEFVELQIEQPRELSKNEYIYAELIYPNGVHLRLHHPLSSKALKDLI